MEELLESSSDDVQENIVPENPQTEAPQESVESGENIEVNTQEEVKKDPPLVPLSALQEERQKRQAYEAQVAFLQEQAFNQVPQYQTQEYDFSDPALVVEAITQQQDMKIHNVKMAISKQMVSEKYDSGLIAEVEQWAFDKANEDPRFNDQIFQSPHPYNFVIQEYQRAKMFEQITPEAFAKFQAWQAQQTQQPAMQVQPLTNQRKPPPQSLAGLPTAAGQSVPVPDAFDDTFR